ncbi:hypothetical protein I656_02002 [Geobacillus sp. WSUCF1]|nr:hypothetical protein I656_02002 [Geobacillus sp. WSUCF1]
MGAHGISLKQKTGCDPEQMDEWCCFALTDG